MAGYETNAQFREMLAAIRPEHVQSFEVNYDSDQYHTHGGDIIRGRSSRRVTIEAILPDVAEKKKCLDCYDEIEPLEVCQYFQEGVTVSPLCQLCLDERSDDGVEEFKAETVPIRACGMAALETTVDLDLTDFDVTLVDGKGKKVAARIKDAVNGRFVIDSLEGVQPGACEFHLEDPLGTVSTIPINILPDQVPVEEPVNTEISAKSLWPDNLLDGLAHRKPRYDSDKCVCGHIAAEHHDERGDCHLCSCTDARVTDIGIQLEATVDKFTDALERVGVTLGKAFTPAVRCGCGTDATGGGRHSNYCPKYNAADWVPSGPEHDGGE